MEERGNKRKKKKKKKGESGCCLLTLGNISNSESFDSALGLVRLEVSVEQDAPIAKDLQLRKSSGAVVARSSVLLLTPPDQTRIDLC